MTAEELKSEIGLEFDALQQVVDELEALRRDVAGGEPTARKRTAAAAFPAQFYSGIENILRRLSRFHGVAPPAGENWHLDLFRRFRPPGHPPLRCSTRRWRGSPAPTGVSGTSSTTDTDSKSSGSG